MSDYYRHKKGGVYRILNEARHSETDEVLIVYQAMYGKREIWARPKGMFFEEGRFTKISKEEAIAQVSIEMKSNAHFPNISFVNETPKLLENDCGFSVPVKSMITLLMKLRLINKNTLVSVANDDELESLIIEKINLYSDEKELESIFHLIQIWGGITGRGIYVHGQGYKWENVLPHYKKLVSICLSIKEVNEDSINELSAVVRDFSLSVQHIGVSFITKHIHYWLCRSLEDNALPIYDSIMANYVMRKQIADIRHLKDYWIIMHTKAKELGIGLRPLERQIFKYAYESIKNHVY